MCNVFLALFAEPKVFFFVQGNRPTKRANYAQFRPNLVDNRPLQTKKKKRYSSIILIALITTHMQFDDYYLSIRAFAFRKIWLANCYLLVTGKIGPIPEYGNIIEKCWCNRVLKWWRHKNDFSEIMGFIRLFGRTYRKKVHTPKNGSLVQ